MKQIRTSLNETEYEQFCRLCEKDKESQYAFVKTAVKERMNREQSRIFQVAKKFFEDGKTT